MLTVQLWSPDTCGCVFHQASDPANNIDAYFITEEEAENIRKERYRQNKNNTNKNPVPPSRTCNGHAHLSDSPAGERKPATKTVHDVVLEENIRKNRIITSLVYLTLGAAESADLQVVARQKLGLAPVGGLTRSQQGDVDAYIQDTYDTFQWEFDETRQLKITSKDPNKTRLQSHVNTLFGQGKAIIN